MFSELVDSVIATTGRKDRLQTIAAYVNASIREVESDRYFVRSTVEDQLTADASPYIWTLPRNFRKPYSVRYPGLAYGQYVRLLPPGPKQADTTDYYYMGPTYLAFAGVSSGDLIDICYVTNARKFSYYAVGARPARFSEETGAWEYLQSNTYVSTLGSDAANEAAQALVSHWLLESWAHVIEEGAVAKLFKGVNDPRAVSSFALYKSFREAVTKAEPFYSREADNVGG